MQHGSLEMISRLEGPDVWQFRLSAGVPIAQVAKIVDGAQQRWYAWRRVMDTSH
jgi:hypothetical protein